MVTGEASPSGFSGLSSVDRKVPPPMQSSQDAKLALTVTGQDQPDGPLLTAEVPPLTRPSAADSVLHSETLKRLVGPDAMQILRCGICMEFFDIPIVLPCGHTFCLHCLTEMCKHASHNNILRPLSELRIGCPNCRVLIYASPILDRNVTCNFIIQSLIESLRARSGQAQVTKSVNTDEVRVGDTIRLVSDLELDKVLGEMDRLTDSLSNRTCLENAQWEIEAIRQEHWMDQGGRKPMRAPNQPPYAQPEVDVSKNRNSSRLQDFRFNCSQQHRHQHKYSVQQLKQHFQQQPSSSHLSSAPQTGEGFNKLNLNPMFHCQGLQQPKHRLDQQQQQRQKHDYQQGQQQQHQHHHHHQNSQHHPQQQQQQSQKQQQNYRLRSEPLPHTNKMSMTGTVRKISPSVSSATSASPTRSAHIARETSQLDSDPAIMSYSYK